MKAIKKKRLNQTWICDTPCLFVCLGTAEVMFPPGKLCGACTVFYSCDLKMASFIYLFDEEWSCVLVCGHSAFQSRKHSEFVWQRRWSVTLLFTSPSHLMWSLVLVYIFFFNSIGFFFLRCALRLFWWYYLFIFFWRAGLGKYSVISTITVSSPKSRLSGTYADLSGLAFQQPVRGGVRREVNIIHLLSGAGRPMKCFSKGYCTVTAIHAMEGGRSPKIIMPHVLTFKGENNATERWEWIGRHDATRANFQLVVWASGDRRGGWTGDGFSLNFDGIGPGFNGHWCEVVRNDGYSSSSGDQEIYAGVG